MVQLILLLNPCDEYYENKYSVRSFCSGMPTAHLETLQKNAQSTHESTPGIRLLLVGRSLFRIRCFIVLTLFSKKYCLLGQLPVCPQLRGFGPFFPS